MTLIHHVSIPMHLLPDLISQHVYLPQTAHDRD